MHAHSARIVFLLSLVIGTSTIGCVRERPFPDQPITLVCPWSAGGGTDRVSRQVAAQLERELGVPVNVVNATGGSGVTGHTRGAVARPDGYTITMLTVELNMLHWRGLTDVTYRDFAPLLLLNCDSAALFVRYDSPLATLNDLESAVRAEPGRIKFSGTAHGGVWHVALAGWLNARGLDASAAPWISINGAGPALQELMAAGVDAVCCSLPEADALLSGGKARCLGVMADSRIPEFPDVPTFREQGHDWTLVGWRGLAAPRDTPPDRVALLAAALERVARSSEMVDFMHRSGFNLTIEGPDDFAATLTRQDELFRGILQGEAFRHVSDEHFGVMMFPAIVGCLLLVMLTVTAVEVRRERAHSVESEKIDASTAARRAYVSAAAVPVSVLFYLATSKSLGFPLTTTLLVGGMLALFRVRPASAAVIAIITSAAVYQVFAVWLRVPLPRGWFGW